MKNNIIYSDKFNSYLSDGLAGRNAADKKWEKVDSPVQLSHQGNHLILNISDTEDKKFINDYLKNSQRFLNYTDSGQFSSQSSPRHLYSGSLLNASA